MRLLRSWYERLHGAPVDGIAPLPEVGETVLLQASVHQAISSFQVRVRAHAYRRILLENADKGRSNSTGESTSDFDLPPRTPVVLSFSRNDGLYRFEARMIGHTRTGALAITRPTKVTRVQRREFYRLFLEVPTVFRVLDAHTDRASEAFAARLVDLSGGGAQLSTSKAVVPGVTVMVRVPSGKQGDLIDVESHVLDCRVATQGASRIYLLRLRFLGEPKLDATDREEIIAYIYEQQRILLRNRKLLR